MMTLEKLQGAFYPVDDLGDGFIRCADELPAKTIYSYFGLCEAEGVSTFVKSENHIDDAFAKLVLKSAGCEGADGLEKAALPPNAYGFTHLLRASAAYHSELKGRLDDERPATTLCVPIFNSEFSGTETPEAFIELRRSIVETANWRRKETPKIQFRFDNAKTKSGTGKGYVFASFDLVMREVDNLIGVADGFIEIINFRDEVVELLPDAGRDFTWIQNRDDATASRVARSAIDERFWNFLTR